MTDDAAGLPPAPEVVQIEVGLLQNFCEILYCPRTLEAAVVDPAWEVDRLLREAAQRNLRITTILVTHTHNDHIDGVDALVAATGAAVVVHPSEAGALSAGLRLVGISYLADGFVVTGDVLFVGGCGRTDFPGGDTAALWRSLQRLTALPEETRVYPGHDYGPRPTSTIGREVLENRYLRCRTFEEFRALRQA
jgi:glyoxylase-like metal-dependent hydrolase (beta-lactamase superfamily II)